MNTSDQCGPASLSTCMAMAKRRIDASREHPECGKIEGWYGSAKEVGDALFVPLSSKQWASTHNKSFF